MTDTKRVDDDDGFKKEMTPTTNPDVVQWPEALQFLPCSKWRRYTWHGISALVCGSFLQSGMGVVNIWGNLVGIFTSKFRDTDPNLSIKTTLVAFSLTYCSAAAAMQLGSYLLHKIDLRLQLLLGMMIYAASMYLSQFPTHFDQFAFFYSFGCGVGMGIVYFLPVLAAWSYFPHIRPICAGTILSWFSLSGIGYAELAIKTLNPNNEKASILIKSGLSTEKYYPPDSYQVHHIPQILTYFAIITVVLSFIGIPFIRWNYAVESKKKNPVLDQVDEHLPFISEESAKEKFALETEIKGLTQIDKKTHAPLIEARPEFVQATPTGDDAKRSANQISVDNHKLLIRMGNGLKAARVTEEGIYAKSDWSWYNQRMCLTDKNFWKIFSMLTLSVTYCFFIKMGNKIFGSIYHDNDAFLTVTSMEAYFFAASARMLAPILMQKIGFFKTYGLVLILQTFLAFTFVYVAHEKHLFRAYVILSLVCEGSHFSIFPPLSGAIYGPVLQIPVNALFFIAFGGSSMFAVWINSAVVPALGYNALYTILGGMSCISMVINYRLQYTFETFMPFVNGSGKAAATKDDEGAQAQKETNAQ